MANPLTVGEMLTAQARLQPERIGARDLERTMTFATWNSRACALANALCDLGLAKGDRVGVIAFNRLEWVEIYAATAKAGLVAVPVNFRLTPPEVAFILDDADVAAVIVEDVLLPLLSDVPARLEAMRQRTIVIGAARSADRIGYDGLIAAADDGEPTTHVGPDDPWCFMYTSGTTGHPKGAIRNHGATAALSLMTAAEFQLSRDDDALLVMPLCHANSLYFFAAFLCCGAAVTIFSRPSFDAPLCLNALATLGVTFTSLVPTHYIMMLEAARTAPVGGDVATVSKLLVSSAPARVETKRAVMALFPNAGLYELYGSTEAGWVTMLHPDEQFDHLGTVGREVIGSAPIRLLDEDGHEVPDGTPGELFSSSPYAFQAYWNRPDKTDQAFRGNYLSVGDVALRDSDGFIRLVDRKANMIISGGENIYPSEVETVLGQHPEVMDVAVIGQPDPLWGESVAAAVVLIAGATCDEAALLAWCHPRFAGYKRPRRILILTNEDMPRTATGKILHRVLRERLAAEPRQPEKSP
ncbi:MAG: AMP-binding protein [Pseudomonadota bacterium]